MAGDIPDFLEATQAAYEDGWKKGHAQALLEAQPKVLAEVEGWLGPQAQAQVSTKPEEWGLPGIFINFEVAGDELYSKLGYFPVHVTITERQEEAR